MKPTFTEGRWVVELRPKGPLRWTAALLASAWLVGWAFGEAFAIALLRSPFTTPSAESPRLPPGLAGQVLFWFVLVWAVVWTFGGCVAAYTLLSWLFGRDRIEYDASGVRRTLSVLWLRRSRWFPREQITDVGMRRGAVSIRTRRGSVILTWFGTEEERGELRKELERVLDLLKAQPRTEELPRGWEYVADRDGIPVLRRRPSTRRRRAALFALGFLALLPILDTVAHETSRDPNGWVPLLMYTLIAVALGGLALWFALGGEAFRLQSGRADVVRWFGWMRWESTYEHASVWLEHGLDRSGDDSNRLMLYGALGYHLVAQAREASDMRRLGSWMAARLGVELQLSEGRRRLHVLGRRRAG